MESAIKIFEDYLNTPNTDYAILFTGKWGSGKTYFWKNNLAELVEKITGKKPIYISLYGVKDINEVAYKILSQLFYKGDKNYISSGVKYLASLGGWVGLKNLDKFLAESGVINARGRMLCFDDLERMELDIRQVLGYINNYVEHEKLKCCIICEEDVVAKNDGYNAIKEKTIGKTINYQPNITQAFDGVAKIYSDKEKIYEFVLRQRENIIATFLASKSENIRALKRGIQNVVNLYSVINETLPDLDLQSKPDIVAGIIAYTIEYVIHGNDKNIISGLERVATCNFPYALPEVIMPKNYDGYVKEFCDKYIYSIELKIFPPLSVLNYITTGYLNESKLKENFESLFPKNDHDKETINTFMNDFWELEPNNFDEMIVEILSKVGDGVFESPGMYMDLYARFLWISGEGLVEIDEAQLREVFYSGIEAAESNGKLNFKRYDYLTINKEGKQEIVGELTKYQQHIGKLEKEYTENIAKQMIGELLAAAEEGPDKFFEMYKEKKEVSLKMPFFHLIRGEVFYEILKKWDAKYILKLCRVLGKRYHISNIKIDFYLEEPFWRKIVDFIQKDDQHNMNKLQKWGLNQFKMFLDRTVDELSKTKKAR